MTYRRKFDIDVKNYSYQSKFDSEPSPGRKTRQGKEINSKTTPKPLKIDKIMKTRKTRQTSEFIDFSTSNMHFRSADAANQLNARRAGEIRMTRRAYILRYISSIRVIRQHPGGFFN